MFKSKISKKFISILMTISMLFSIIAYSTVSASAFDKSYISNDGMKLGYSIINGYSKLSAKNGLTSYEKSAVYSGLDVSKPYVITLVGLFYITKGVDVDKAIGDNDYTMEIIEKLDSFLNTMGVKNDRAKALKAELENSGAQILTSFDTAGLYIIKADGDYCKNLLNNENVDFVLSGGEIPKSMNDLNFDGKSDEQDSKLIQQYLVGELVYEDADENAYIRFACDINSDKNINIIDASELQR